MLRAAGQNRGEIAPGDQDTLEGKLTRKMKTHSGNSTRGIPLRLASAGCMKYKSKGSELDRPELAELAV